MCAHGGSLLAGFEDHHIARDERRDDMPVGQVCGEIVGAEHRQDPMRLVPNCGAALERAVELLVAGAFGIGIRSEEHTSELQSLMRNSYAVLCLKKHKIQNT